MKKISEVRRSSLLLTIIGLCCWNVSAEAKGAPGTSIRSVPDTAAATITVRTGSDSGGVCPGPTCTLRQAVALANSTPADDTIDFQIPVTDSSCAPSGICTVTLLAGEISVGDAGSSGKLTITNATGPNKLVISGNGAGRVFYFEFGSNSVLDGVTVRNGNGKESNNPSHDPSVNDHGGGILVYVADLSITNSVVTGNAASLQGGGIYNYLGNLKLAGTAVISNTTDTSALQNPSIRGGGIYSFAGTVVATDSSINGNTSKVGAGIFNDNASVTVTNSTVNNNVASTSDPNEFPEAGGIYSNFGTTVLSFSSVSGNTANVGGGVSGVGGTLTVTGSVISGNTVAGDGAGIQIHGGPNPASTSVTITGSTFSDNNITNFGNGSALVATTPGTVLNISNSTFSRNGGAGAVGTIATKTSGTISSSTITDNFSENAPALLPFVNSSLNVKNTIVAGNRSGIYTCRDVGGSFVSQGNNVIGIASDSNGPCQTGFVTGQNNDKLGTYLSPLDALLGPLGYYGGGTQTHPLLTGSPALDAGNAIGAPATDQRGAARVGPADVGSFELNNASNGGNYVATLPTGAVSQPYNQVIAASNVSNGTTYSYTISSGGLPPGLTLTSSSFAPQSTISISGTPAVAGLFTFTISATGNGHSTETRYSINITGASGTCTGAPSGMVAWYRGEGNAVDSTSNHNNGSPQGQGAVTYAGGKVGQAFQFNQALESVPDANSLDLTTGLTIEGWVNPTQAGGDNGLSSFVFKGDIASATNQSYGILFLNTRQFSLRLGNSSGITGLNSVASLPLNTYTHIAATYDGTNMCVYVNGSLDGACQSTPLGTLGNTSVPLTFGSFAGAMDELQIFNRALSSNEILGIYNAGAAGVCSAPTAASVQVSGRVLTADGVGVRGAIVSLNDTQGATRTTVTNAFGYYSFNSVLSGATYVISASSKRFNFGTRVVNVADTLTGIDFTSGR